MEDEWVDVLAQLVQQEPVAKLATPAHGLDLLPGAGPGPGPQEHLPQARGFHGPQAVDDLDAGDDGEDDEPEPQEDVDLLVHDVDGEDAEAVELLHRAGGAVLPQRAFSDL